MKNWLVKILLLPLLCHLTFIAPAHAWNADGHHTVGGIADQMLVGSKAGKRVQDILGNYNLSQISVWGDCVRGIDSEKDFAYTSTGKYPECAIFETPEEIAAMSDYVKRNHDQCARKPEEESCHKQYHYANLDYRSDRYHDHLVGSSDRDIVHAVQAAIVYLKTGTAPAPFQFKTQREALAILAHVVGDLHQPLHIGSVYLNAQGEVIQVSKDNYDRATHTVGGNALQCPCGNFHALWDDVPVWLKRGKGADVLINRARQVSVTEGEITEWPARWAQETLIEARHAFANTQFSPATSSKYGNNWSIGLPLAYEKTMVTIKEQALARGGARLAQILQTIWPE